MAFDPHDIGKQKKPEVDDTASYLKDTDQRWFSEVADLYPSEGKVWDGTGPAPETTIRKLAKRYLETTAVNRLARRWSRARNGSGE